MKSGKLDQEPPHRPQCDGAVQRVIRRDQREGRVHDGVRTFRLIEGEPLQTSFGRDLYARVFADRTRAEARALAEPVPT